MASLNSEIVAAIQERKEKFGLAEILLEGRLMFAPESPEEEEELLKNLRYPEIKGSIKMALASWRTQLLQLNALGVIRKGENLGIFAKALRKLFAGSENEFAIKYEEQANPLDTANVA